MSAFAWHRIGSAKLGAILVYVKHPFDARAGCVASALPGGYFAFKDSKLGDAAIEALSAQH